MLSVHEYACMHVRMFLCVCKLDKSGTNEISKDIHKEYTTKYIHKKKCVSVVLCAHVTYVGMQWRPVGIGMATVPLAPSFKAPVT